MQKTITNMSKRLALALSLFISFTTMCTGALAATNIDLDANEYGYGKYIVTARGVWSDGVYDEDQVIFYYLPTTAEITEDKKTGEVGLDLDYAPDDGTDAANGDVAKIIINVYDENGNLVEGLSPIEVLAPEKHAVLPFEKYNLPSGDYTISISSYDRNGNLLFEPLKLPFHYERVAVPNTGGLFTGLNISRSDYLATGMIIFFIAAAAGIMTVVKRSKSNKRVCASKRRR